MLVNMLVQSALLCGLATSVVSFASGVSINRQMPAALAPTGPYAATASMTPEQGTAAQPASMQSPVAAPSQAQPAPFQPAQYQPQGMPPAGDMMQATPQANQPQVAMIPGTPQQLMEVNHMKSATNDVLTLWNGVDIPEKRAALSVPEKVTDSPAERNLQVFGLQNSGVDLLTTMLYKNFGNQLNYFGSDADESTNHYLGFWMHSDLQEKWRLERETVKPFEKAGLYSVVMIRSPLSWLQAMREKPQELSDCVQGNDWLSRPCLHSMPGGFGSRVPTTSYPSLEAIWTHFNTGFHNMADFGLSRRLVVPYENLLRNPEGALDMVAKFLELPKPASGWSILADPSHSREEAVKNLYKKEYLKLFSDLERTQACVRLDGRLQSMYAYDDCKKGQIGGGDNRMQPFSLLQLGKDNVWSGNDLSQETRSSIDHRLGHGFLRKAIDGPAKINVNVFGLQNSGVDLLNAMLHINFGNQVNYYGAGVANEGTNSRHGHWMHANLKEKWRAEKAAISKQKDEHVHAIVIIRDPLSWLQSMRATPQELEQCVSGDDWLSRPCTHKVPAGKDSPAPSLTLPSLSAVWNQWYDGYQNAGEYGFEHYVMITYENLVRNPKGAMSHIANFLGLKEPAQGWAMPSESASRDEALNDLFTKRFMEEYSPTEKAQACQQLDADLQRLYGYGDCEWTKHHQGQGPRGGGEVHTGTPR